MHSTIFVTFMIAGFLLLFFGVWSGWTGKKIGMTGVALMLSFSIFTILGQNSWAIEEPYCMDRINNETLTGGVMRFLRIDGTNSPTSDIDWDDHSLYGASWVNSSAFNGTFYGDGSNLEGVSPDGLNPIIVDDGDISYNFSNGTLFDDGTVRAYFTKETIFGFYDIPVLNFVDGFSSVLGGIRNSLYILGSTPQIILSNTDASSYAMFQYNPSSDNLLLDGGDLQVGSNLDKRSITLYENTNFLSAGRARFDDDVTGFSACEISQDANEDLLLNCSRTIAQNFNVSGWVNSSNFNGTYYGDGSNLGGVVTNSSDANLMEVKTTSTLIDVSWKLDEVGGDLMISHDGTKALNLEADGDLFLTNGEKKVLPSVDSNTPGSYDILYYHPSPEGIEGINTVYGTKYAMPELDFISVTTGASSYQTVYWRVDTWYETTDSDLFYVTCWGSTSTSCGRSSMVTCNGDGGYGEVLETYTYGAHFHTDTSGRLQVRCNTAGGGTYYACCELGGRVFVSDSFTTVGAP